MSINSTHCRRATSEVAREKRRQRMLQYEVSPKLCLYCSSPIFYDKRINKFCSSSCAATFNNFQKGSRPQETRQKISESMLRFEASRTTPKIITRRPRLRYCMIRVHECSACGGHMTNPKRKTCSIECRDKACSVNGTLKRRLKWDGHTFQSKWEIEIAKALTKNNINWEQPTKRFRWFDTTLQKYRTYLPDFYLIDFNVFLDVKNDYKQRIDTDKIKQLKNLLPLEVFNLKDMLSYIQHL